jgi:hypothetical protein
MTNPADYLPDPSIYGTQTSSSNGHVTPQVTVNHGVDSVFQTLNYESGFGVHVNHSCEPGERKVRKFANGNSRVEMSREEAEEIVTNQAEGIIAEMVANGPTDYEFVVTEMRAVKVRVAGYSRYEAEAIAARMIEDGVIEFDDAERVSVKTMYHGRPMSVDGDAWDRVGDAKAIVPSERTEIGALMMAAGASRDEAVTQVEHMESVKS